MKNYIILFTILCLFVGQTFAQVDRSKLPEAGPAPEIKLGEYETFTLKNGMKVFVVKNTKLPRVAFNLVIDRDPILEKDKAGYVEATGDLLRRGTKNRTKDQLDEEIDFIGANLSTSSTGVYASSLSKHKDKLMELMADVVLNPAFPKEELDKIIKQQKSSLAASKDNPQAIASNVQSALVYGKDHPYGEITTEETIKNITLDDAKTYYNTYFKPNVAYLAIVGDINKDEAKKLVKKYFGDWKKGEVPTHEYKTPQTRAKGVVALVDRPTSVQSVVNVTHPIELKPNNPDVITARVMNEILGGGDARLFRNLREGKGYTYGAYSSLSSDELVGKFVAYANVRNAVTDSAVMEFMSELKKMRNEKVGEKELDAAKNFITGSFARSLESPQTIASFALNTELNKLDKDYYRNYLKNVAAVTQEDVQRVAQKYIQPDKAYIMVVGSGDDVAEGLKKFGEIERYDIYGNKEKAMENTEITAEQVVNNYIKAIGGKETLSKVNNLIMRSSLKFNEMDLSNTEIKKSPDKYMNMTMMGMQELNKMIYNQGKAKVYGNGQSMDVPEKQAQAMAIAAYPFPEMLYKQEGIELELKGTANVEGNEAYKVMVKLPSGDKIMEYYDVKTGLKLKKESQAGTQVIEDYQEVQGIKFPDKIKIISPMGTIEGQVTSVEINTEVPDDVFQLK